jgi:hypothetical protein
MTTLPETFAFNAVTTATDATRLLRTLGFRLIDATQPKSTYWTNDAGLEAGTEKLADGQIRLIIGPR